MRATVTIHPKLWTAGCCRANGTKRHRDELESLWVQGAEGFFKPRWAYNLSSHCFCRRERRRTICLLYWGEEEEDEKSKTRYLQLLVSHTTARPGEAGEGEDGSGERTRSAREQTALSSGKSSLTGTVVQPYHITEHMTSMSKTPSHSPTITFT